MRRQKFTGQNWESVGRPGRLPQVAGGVFQCGGGAGVARCGAVAAGRVGATRPEVSRIKRRVCTRWG